MRSGAPLSLGRSSALEPWRPGIDGDWDRSAAGHLFLRAGFGPSVGDLERAVEEGFEATLRRLLATEAPDPERVSGAQALLAANKIELLQGWWMSLILDGGSPLVERVTLMWHDHFATSHDKVRDVRMMHRQNTLFREQGLGDFRSLLQAVATDPAMLVWLDGNENKRGAPNENFAREVMELFALGIGNYEETDIQEAARAFTGWGTSGRSFALREDEHDGGEKRIFGRVGRYGGDEAIERILDQPACPRHVAARILTEFVGDAQSDMVEGLAAELVENEWNVGRAIETVLRSRLFHSTASRSSRIAGPVELVARTARALEARVPPLEAARAAERMGQSLFRPPSVKGWNGGRHWINAGTWLARHNALAALAQDGERVDLDRRFGSPDRSEAPVRIASELLPSGASPELIAVLESAATDANSDAEALRVVTSLVLTAPEYHLV